VNFFYPSCQSALDDPNWTISARKQTLSKFTNVNLGQFTFSNRNRILLKWQVKFNRIYAKSPPAPLPTHQTPKFANFPPTSLYFPPQTLASASNHPTTDDQNLRHLRLQIRNHPRRRKVLQASRRPPTDPLPGRTPTPQTYLPQRTQPFYTQRLYDRRTNRRPMGRRYEFPGLQLKKLVVRSLRPARIWPPTRLQPTIFRSIPRSPKRNPTHRSL